MLEVVFWSSLALILYTVAGFPALLYVRSRMRYQPVKEADVCPRVTLIVVAHNEAPVLRRRLENILELDYPRDRLSVLLVSDGSDDETVQIAREFNGAGVRFLDLPRGGKVRALNAAAAAAQGEVLVFSDANGMCAKDALRVLMRPFADPQVGGASGSLRLKAEETGQTATDSESVLRKYDRLISEWQSAAGSVTAAAGALYAIRSELFFPVEPGLSDDDAIPFAVLERGYRLVYQSGARVVQCRTTERAGEFRRKARFLTQALQTVFHFKGLLNPFRHGFYSLQLFSHKLLRWLLVWPVLFLFAASAALAAQGSLYAAAFAVQAVFYSVAALAAVLPDGTSVRLPAGRAMLLPYYFCLAYAASLRAQWLALRKFRFDLWQPTRRTPVNNIEQSRKKESATRVAYIMSRFPAVTETFILYEMLELQRRGIQVDVYPLMRMREAVRHPDLAAIMPRVHYLPFASLSILRANWHYLRKSPRRYLRMWGEVLGGTLGSFNFFLGALLFTPKSAAVARELEADGVTHVHAHFATHPALSALVIHRLSGIPFSITAHGHDVHCERRMLREKVEAAEFVAAVSTYNRDLILRECGRHLQDKVHVIRCGTDTGFFDKVAQPNAPAPLRIVCTATFREVKGHKYLIEACRLLCERGVDFHCDLIGGGELREEVERQIAASGLSDRFTVHGPQPRPLVRRLLQCAHVKVLPSILASNGMREGIPVALMEAMACGLPVVSSHLSGIPELVSHGESGLLVAPRDVVGLADALELLAREPELRARMGDAGRVIVERDFDLAANAHKLASRFFSESSGLQRSEQMPSSDAGEQRRAAKRPPVVTVST